MIKPPGTLLIGSKAYASCTKIIFDLRFAKDIFVSKSNNVSELLVFADEQLGTFPAAIDELLEQRWAAHNFIPAIYHSFFLEFLNIK